MDPKYRFAINVFIILHLIYITYVENEDSYFKNNRATFSKNFYNPFSKNKEDEEKHNFFYLFIYLYLWFAVNMGWKIFGIMTGILVLFLILLIYILNRTGMGPPLALISIFFGGLMYTKLPIDEFKNSSNVERVVHALIIVVSGLMIYLYSYSPQPKMKGFALVTLVFFLNAIAILYGARESGIAPGKKLARVFKWSIYILIISSIVWYNTYGTVGSYTHDSLYTTFDPRRFVRDKPDVFPFNWIPFELLTDGQTINDLTEDIRDDSNTDDRAKSSEEDERKDISQDYYN